MIEITMISTGEEVLLGDITDTNAAWLSRFLFEQGLTMTRRVTVGDHCERLAKEIESCSLNSDIVIVNGGLGPTSDDLTAVAAAMAANVGLEQSDHWVAEMKAKYEKLNREMPAANLKQAMLPEGAELIDNPVGTACGFAIKLNRAWIFFTPGVPSEFKIMVKDQILPRLQTQYPANQPLHCSRLFTYGLSESSISDAFQHLTLPQGYEIGYRSSLPFIEVKLFAPEQGNTALVLLAEMEALLGDNIVGKQVGLIENLSNLLTHQNKKLAILEQSTGGFVVNWLNQQPELNEYVVSASVQNIVVDTKTDMDALVNVASEQLQGLSLIPNSQIGLFSGTLHDGAVTVGLITDEGQWIQHVQFKRVYSHDDQRCVIATVLLDMLRRYLQGVAIFGHYESLNRLFENHSL
ncbi:CinA family nicotinamide mononucleotide deamidase-related protein [Photobacterium lucens]|uniref:CinA family nicotinamide mononucleotide deamidase-related protein n=1 Tax=Photobacterium lucens TaxID=2562949 RepID=UPI00136E4F18|nr:CinA family nicotinamide mononucleotide deamidase-related protein [Photobacterium lucens]MBP2700625.1 CinA family nicotinamide mononucleotide deamidase-related protein [Vibrio parahaemolyticus]MZG57839.1 CinA family nicotinamide mononucleotide deamidase-related protein [Photobacterium lucens]MZG82917.1 CinA family nicotinamide mononucleotide deamidase-related protein [Photobacterium lucens]